MLLAENSIWSSKERERRTESRSPKGGVFYLGNGYPVKTDAFTPSSFKGRDTGGWVVAWLGWAGWEGSPCCSRCAVPLLHASLPQAPAEWRSCSLTGQDLVCAGPAKHLRKLSKHRRGPCWEKAVSTLRSLPTTTSRVQVNHGLLYGEVQV